MVLVVIAGCTRPNPAFDGTGGTHSGPDEGPGSLGDPSSSTSPTSADTTSPPLESSTGITTGDSGEPSGTSTVDGGPIHVYQGPIATGLIDLGAQALDPGYNSCLVAADSFAGLCPSDDRIASLLRLSGGMLDELVSRGVPTDRPILSPASDLIAADLQTWIDVGPGLALADTPSVFILDDPKPFWTGGRLYTDSNCLGWSSNAVEDFGTIGSPDATDASWLAADLVTCDMSLPILCSCW